MFRNNRVLEVVNNGELARHTATINRVIIALSHIAGLSDIKILRCIADNQDYLAHEYTGVELVANITTKKYPQGLSKDQWFDLLANADNDIAEANKLGLVLVSFIEDGYPQTLRQLNFKGNPSFPPMLYVRGSVAYLSHKALAVVGTREPDQFGIDITKRYVDFFTDIDYVIVAGLAKGVDTVAHQQTVANHKPTVAWMAGGFDSPIYPKQNAALADDIVANHGALVWTRPFGAGVSGRDFVVRDNYQAGMSDATIAVETDIKGGTTHTMQNTLDQNKPLACPDRFKYDGFIPNICRGTDLAIKDGRAMGLHTHQDVFDFADSFVK